MDNKTRQQRARNKAMSSKHGGAVNGLSQFESRGLGRKNKPAETFQSSVRQCEHISGGKTITFRKTRRQGSIKPGQARTYLVTIIKGGVRCPKTQFASGKCLEHLRNEQEVAS
jgi:hypothetical protein